MAIKLDLKGFDEMLRKIEKANGNVDTAAKKCMDKSAQIMQDELKAQMQAADLENEMSRLISRMPAPRVKNDHGLWTAKVGYEKGAYNPDNPSDAYKVIFINYGTPRRTKHGKVKARGFIDKAKKKAKPKIKKEQEKTLDEILRGLQ